MFILLNAIIASLDGLIMGIGLKLKNIKLNFKHIFIILFINIFIYGLFINIYYYFHLSFMNKNIVTCLYLFLAFNLITTKNNDKDFKTLTVKNTCLLALTHSLDGSIISLGFVYKYPNMLIVFIFSLFSISILLLGFYFANIFKNIKNKEFISSSLFILLAILNNIC